MAEMKTFIYSTVEELDIHVDIYFPPSTTQPDAALGNNEPSVAVPGVVFFHGGGMIRGGRENIFVEFKDAVLAKGWLFISPDHRLLFPCDITHIAEDVAALWKFLGSESIHDRFSLDMNSVFVSGHSGGAYPACLAALYSVPKPLALFSVSGQGGNILSTGYFSSRTLRSGKVKKQLYKEFLDGHVAPVANVPWTWTARAKVLPPNKNDPQEVKRKSISSLLLQEGLRLDFILGIQGISRKLEERWRGNPGISKAELAEVLPVEVRKLVPELWVGGLEAVYLLHGTGDRSVDIQESLETARTVREGGGSVVEAVVEGWGHGWDGGVWERSGKGVMEFFEERLRGKREREVSTGETEKREEVENIESRGINRLGRSSRDV
ncbi:hypothetical protein RUND412_000075 [Rhizina undulata]